MNGLIRQRFYVLEHAHSGEMILMNNDKTELEKIQKDSGLDKCVVKKYFMVEA
jgi:hypothetical protein